MVKCRRAIKALGLIAITVLTGTTSAQTPVYRPPSVPLVVHNPFLDIWSNADKLTDDVTRHWTKHPHALDSIIRVDGQNFRLMGNEPKEVPALPQVVLKVLPTRTIYDFEGANVHVTLTFVTPALPTDIDVLSRPLTYLVYDVKATDGQPHAVSVLLSASSEIAIDSVAQKVVWDRPKIDGFTALKVGSNDQPYVLRAGDDSRIDWGYLYLSADANQSKGAIGMSDDLLKAFTTDGTLPAQDVPSQPTAVRDGHPTLALTIDFGKVAAENVNRRAMVSYDDIWAIDFFGKKSRGYWRRNPDMNGETLITTADKEYDSLLKKCIAFDDELMADLTKVGGESYAYMCSLAYRQCIAGCGIAADANGQPMMFTKENTSNGNMGTVDVLFPMDPIWVFLSPTLAKATIAPVFQYASSPQWKLPYAPHDLGEYPIAFSKSNKDGTEDASEAMPVEETGNLIILADAIAHCDGNTKFCDPWWPQISKWVNYLEKYGPDPEEQLCTDDFNGRLAHNSNLGVKAIVGLGAYADLCKMRGDTAGYNRYIALARADAKNWMKQADDGEHYRLAYNKPGTWSQLYNLVFDQILELNVFPPEVAKKEIAHYKTVLKPYGLPLDSRNMRTKSDWTIWTASLADNQEDFETLIAPMQNYLQTTPDRVPFSDGYFVDRLDRRTNFFHARPVIGGVFARMLTDKTMWMKWAHKDKQVTNNWAPLPLPPIIKELVPTSRRNPITWSYTTSNPGESWSQSDFDSSSWKKGAGGFGGGDGNPHTAWHTDDIWIRRDFTMPAGEFKNLKFVTWHDEDVEIYINGVLAGAASGYNTGYMPMDINAAGLQAIKPGKNSIAVHCHQTVGGQYIDVGIAEIIER